MVLKMRLEKVAMNVLWLTVVVEVCWPVDVHVTLKVKRHL